MNPILFPSTETSFSSNGLGRFTDCISCKVQETLNGVYELMMVYPVTGAKYGELKQGRILYCLHDDTRQEEPFEIYRITKPLNGKVTVNAWQISYRLRKIVARPFEAQGVQNAMAELKAKSITTNPFFFYTDKSSAAVMKITEPHSVRELMGGMQGSVLDTYGGEWQFQGFSCWLRSRRGNDTDLTIKYGKNLSDLSLVSDMTNFWTGVVPYWTGTDPDGGELTTYYNGVIWSSVHDQFEQDMVVAVDASGAFDEEPTQAQLETFGQNYITANAKAMIPQSTKISFVQLWQTEEYKDVAALQRLSIGDTVKVYYEQLGVDTTARIVSYTYDVIAERYESMTLGEVRASLSSSIQKEIEDAVKDVPTKSWFEQALEAATNLITGGLGGYVVINQDTSGHPEEILIMNTPDKLTATKVIRLNQNGIGFGNSYNGPFNSAWTIDGTFDAQLINVINLSAASINTGTMLADRIRGGLLQIGGLNNENGTLQVLDASGNVIGTWNNDGLTATGDIEMLTTLNPSVNYRETGSAKMTSGTFFYYGSGSNGKTLPDLEINHFKRTSGGTSEGNLRLASNYDGSRILESDGGLEIQAKHGSTASYLRLRFANTQVKVEYGDRTAADGNTYLEKNTVYSQNLKCQNSEATTAKVTTVTPGGGSSSVKISGGLTVTGTKSRCVDTDDYGEKDLYCYETAAPLFGDVGGGVTDEDGVCVVMIDDVLSETLRTDVPYYVFLQAEGDGDLKVVEKTRTYFTVKGTSGTPFAWELKARQTGYENIRLETTKIGDFETDISDLESIYDDELYGLMSATEETAYEDIEQLLSA